jgi:N-acyl-D-amino-acid deacylase
MSNNLDIVLSGGRIVDGCGNPWFYGDVGIRDGRIARIGPPGTLAGKQTFKIEGRYVTPGFIDIHTHSDLSILINRQAESVVRQGVTTNLTGNCGWSPAPIDEAHLAEMQHHWGHYWDVEAITWKWRSFAEYMDVMRVGGIAINIAPLVGHGALRIAAMGFANRAPTEEEMNKMKRLAAESMEAGVFGLSTGLVYPPGCFAKTEEIIELCRVVARHHGIYTSHIRGERETILDAVTEAIRIGQEAGLPVQVSHNAPKYGAPEDARANLALIEAARARGQDVTVDNDVHTDLAPRLSRALPQPVLDRSTPDLLALLSDPVARRQIQSDIEQDRLPAFGPSGLVKHHRFDRIVILYAPKQPHLVGQTVEQIARQRNRDTFETYFDLIVEEQDEIVGIFDYIEDKNIRLLLQHPLVMVSSDGQVMANYGPLADPGAYSPCSYGEYPGVLERYVRQEPVLRLEEAIRKMTSYPAQRLGLMDRGTLRPGAWADVVVFDLDRIHDRATNLWPHSYPFENIPHQYPEGIDYVFVNGTLVIAGEEHAGALPGRVLKRGAS